MRETTSMPQPTSGVRKSGKVTAILRINLETPRQRRFRSSVGSLLLTDPTYGSDKVGLVWAYLFQAGQPPRAISSDDAAERLRQPAAPGEFFWLHVSLSHAASERWVNEHLPLASAFRESLHHSQALASSTTRVELVDDSVVAVLNDVQFFAAESSAASTVSLSADSRMLVTARTTPLRSVDRLREAVKRGDQFRSPANLVAHLLRDQADVLVEIVREVTGHVDAVEDQLFGGRTGSNRLALGSLRRRLVRLQRLLAPEPAALFRLLNRPPVWIGSADVEDLRQSAEELAAAVADSVALVERVKLLQEELFALVSEQTNRTLFVLTVVTVLALPATIVSSLLGMNIAGLPLQKTEGGFWLVAGFAALVAAIGAWWILGRRR
jgi:zinc transporter